MQLPHAALQQLQQLAPLLVDLQKVAADVGVLLHTQGGKRRGPGGANERSEGHVHGRGITEEISQTIDRLLSGCMMIQACVSGVFMPFLCMYLEVSA